MNLWWSHKALRRLRKIREDIEQYDGHPKRAIKIHKTIQEQARLLDELPHRGVKTRIPGVYELVLPAIPYIISYAVTDEVTILNVKATKLLKERLKL